MEPGIDPTSFIHELCYEDLPKRVLQQLEYCLLDLIGVGLGGATTPMSHLIRNHAKDQFSGRIPMLFDGRLASESGVALSGGMTIDALDGHDGYNPAKGHVGCGIFPAAFAFAHSQNNMGGKDFLTNIALGYELGSRLAPALHGTVSDYHTSGAWVSVACAGIGARAFALDKVKTRHALGIAEYHGPRSQMMRSIDHPTMVKDGSGWGAMAGVSAVFLAKEGFTGAPAVTIEAVPAFWGDLSNNWLIQQQYFKPYPVCRWAHAPIDAILKLRARHRFTSHDVNRLDIYSFHEATRLAKNTPQNTEEAQYSTSFPCAVALVRGIVAPRDVSQAALNDPEIIRISRATNMHENEAANAAFPNQRLAQAVVTLRDGTTLESEWTTPRWDATCPPTEAELRTKFHDFADSVIGNEIADRIEAAIHELPEKGLRQLSELLVQPISREIT